LENFNSKKVSNDEKRMQDYINGINSCDVMLLMAVP